MTGNRDGQIKIRIPLLGAALESGATSELVWAEPLGGNRYRVWNIPAFAYNLDLRAIVECVADPSGEPPVAVRVVEPGDCHVVRLLFQPSATDAQIEGVLELLASRRAIVEKFKRTRWGVGLRSREDYEWFGDALLRFVKEGILGFESGLQRDQPTLGGPPGNPTPGAPG